MCKCIHIATWLKVHLCIMLSDVRRSAVFFKSLNHSGIFTVEKCQLNLPGGGREANETYEEAAVREVKEELGGWPSNVSADLSNVFHWDVGVTRYFVINVPECSWQSCFHNLTELFGNRSKKETRKITELQMHNIGVVCAGNISYPARSEILRFFAQLRACGELSGTVCASVDGLSVEQENVSSLVQFFDGGALCDAPAGDAAASSVAVAATVDEVAVLEDESPVGTHATYMSRNNGYNGYFHCQLCNTQRKHLRKCWECASWTCSKCSFWCTHCPKNYQKYNVCETCYDTKLYLWRTSETIWCCHSCW